MSAIHTLAANVLQKLFGFHCVSVIRIAECRNGGSSLGSNVGKPHLQNMTIRSAIDAQFSAAYNFSVAAHGVTMGPEWQDEETMRDPKILAFMQKVTCKVHPEYTRRPLKDRLMSLGRIEVDANGTTHTEEAPFAYGTPRPGFEIDDSALAGKFRHNAVRVLRQSQIDEAATAIMQLENVGNVSELMKLITP